MVLRSTHPRAPPHRLRPQQRCTHPRSLASAVKGSLTLISSCVAVLGPLAAEKASFFFPVNKCLFSPVLTCSCIIEAVPLGRRTTKSNK